MDQIESREHGLSRIPVADRRESVMDLIKQLIVRDDLRPGDPLPSEAELCSELAVSRSSIREALRTLAALDIVEVRHGHGSYVGRLSMRALVESLAFRSLLGDADDRQVVLDLVEVRQLLELATAEHVVSAVRGGRHQQLSDLTDAMARRAARGQDHLDEDRAFHLALTAPVGNDLVGQFTGAFWDVHAIVVPWLDLDAPAQAATVRAHRDIVEAAVAGDVAAYSAAVVRHYDPIRARLSTLRDDA